MKFLCVECDEAMRLQSTRGPDEGSMSVLFECPSCGRQIAMLTNSMETQMVRSLGVKIGSGGSTPGRMETIRNSLRGVEGLGAQAHPRNDATPPTEQSDSLEQAEDQQAGGKCPFTGVVNEAFGRQEEVQGFVWTAEAEERLGRIPSFVQGMVRKGIEEYAREIGVTEIDAKVMEAARSRFGM